MDWACNFNNYDRVLTDIPVYSVLKIDFLFLHNIIIILNLWKFSYESEHEIQGCRNQSSSR